MNSIAFVLALASVAPRWEVVSDDGKTRVMTRKSDASAVREILAQRIMAVPAKELAAVAGDVAHYTEIIPYTTRVHILSNNDGVIIAHQRMEMPMLSAREYVVEVATHESNKDGHAVFTTAWRPAHGFDEVMTNTAVRVDINEGSWTFEQVDATHTLATFWLHVDPAGDVPSALVDLAQQMSVGKYLDNLEARAKP
jgi:hypothetical protein